MAFRLESQLSDGSTWTVLAQRSTERGIVASWEWARQDADLAGRTLRVVGNDGREYVVYDGELIDADSDLGRAAIVVHKGEVAEHLLRQHGPLDDRGVPIHFDDQELRDLEDWAVVVEQIASGMVL